MKKKYLLTVLPALLVLSACQSGLKTEQNNNQLLEDTLAHEEIFGEAEQLRPLSPRLAPGDPGDPANIEYDMLYQRQYNDATGKLAIRFVAALKTANVSAVWKRGLAQGTGAEVLEFDTYAEPLASTKLYKTLNNGASSIVAGEPGDFEDYAGFAIYTLRNIDYATYSDSYLAAYLTITDLNAPSNTIDTEVYAAKVEKNGDNYLSSAHTFVFNKDDSSEENYAHDYFLEGRIGGENNKIILSDETVDDDSKHFASYTNISFSDGDYFGSFYFDGNVFRYCGYDEYYEGCRGFFKNSSLNGYAAPYSAETNTYATNGQYNLGISKEEGKYWHVSANKISEPTDYHLYLKPNSHWTGDGAWFQVYAFKDSTSAKGWYWMAQIGSTGIYEVNDAFYANKGDYDTIIFCRMNPNTGAVDKNWYDDSGKGVWNQSNNIPLTMFTSNEGPNAVCNITGSGDNNYNYIAF